MLGIIESVIKVFAPASLAFFFGLLLSPLLIRFLVTHKMWKKKPKTQALGGGETPLFNALHKEREVSVPRMGGIVIWVTTLVVMYIFWSLHLMFPDSLAAHKLNFLSRGQTWLPLFTLVSASLVGLIDDYLTVSEKGGYARQGLPLSIRILVVVILGIIGSWWFYTKLEVTHVRIPFYGTYEIGYFFYLFFTTTMLAIFSGGVIDGIDGLSGGILATIFGAYAGIAFFQNQIDLAAFSATIMGSIMAFLWFNIPPAKFYMTETGILGLTTTLTVLAFLTDQVVVLPIIALPLFVASGSVILQLASKKFLGRKIFKIAPIHHHFEAIGWPSYQVTMRFWIIGIISAIIGMSLALIS